MKKLVLLCTIALAGVTPKAQLKVGDHPSTIGTGQLLETGEERSTWRFKARRGRTYRSYGPDYDRHFGLCGRYAGLEYW